MADDPKTNGEKLPEEATDEPALSFEAEPPGSAEEELYIEPAGPPGEAAAGEEVSDPDSALGRRSRPAASSTAGEDHSSGPRMVIAVASGKGGVGKTLLAASIGVFLAQLGKRVVLVDVNLGSSNLHTLLGMQDSTTSLHAFLSKDIKWMGETICPTPFRNLGLIPGKNNAAAAANPKQAQRTRLQHQIRSIAADYVIIDLPPGTEHGTLDLFLAADLHVVITTPEPTAIESAFRLIKSAFVRRVRTIRGVDRVLEELQPAAHFGIPTPCQIYERACVHEAKLGEAVQGAMAAFKPRLVVNQTRTRDDLELGPNLAVIARRHLGLPFDYLGYLDSDDVVWVTVRKRRPLLVEYPEAKVSKDLERVTRRVLSLENKERPECIGVPKPLVRQNHYEILSLHFGATDEEVRRAQRRVRQLYGAHSIATYGIVPPTEVELMLERIDEAHAVLMDAERRHYYDQQLFSDEELGAEPGPIPPPAPIQEGVMNEQETTPVEMRPEMPVLSADTVFDGALLRTIRMARGLELQDIAERTKISKAYLQAIEDEDFVAAPAPAYLRGFVKALAKDLKLQPEQVARTYMERYHSRLK